uniref:Uncharacterized protein n=1 Tax=Streptomyces rimofaciens TaxID=504097 RepID=H9BDW9_9ACTN|nr:predicted protein [Streptomyces rimofaciens]
MDAAPGTARTAAGTSVPPVLPVDAERPAARRTLAMEEGTPRQWEGLGLHGVPEAVEAALGPAAELVVAARGGGRSPLPGLVFAQPCLGRSAGVARDLPVSVVWETGVALAIARALDRPAVIGLCVYEEILQQPHRDAEFTALGAAVARTVEALGRLLGVAVTARVETAAPRAAEVPARRLYGLYTPFSESTYPRGFPNEAEVLRAFSAYCGRYEDAARREASLWVTEGVHLAKAALLGLGPGVPFLATTPLPDPAHPGRLLQDAPAATRVTLERRSALPADWWPEQALERALGTGLRRLTEDFHALIEDFHDPAGDR